MDDIQIKHSTKVIPGIIRKEIYEYQDIQYVEQFDNLTGKRTCEVITMYGGVDVCYVGNDGTISLNMPTNWVSKRKYMKTLITDIARLDNFLVTVSESYANN